MSGLSSSDISCQASEGKPVWARSDALPVKSSEADAYGFLNQKGVEHGADSLASLVEAGEKSRDGIKLVWTPESEHMVVPEEVPELRKILRDRWARFAARDIQDGLRLGAVFGLMLAWTLYVAWHNGGKNLEALYSHQLSGLAALLLFIFGLLPLYEGWKMRRFLARTKLDDMVSEIPEARFDIWMERQKTPITWFLLGGLLLVGLIQFWIDYGGDGIAVSIQEAGQLKRQASNFPHIDDARAWWRLLTAGVLHGNPIHFLMNAAGIFYLGRRAEVLVRWPHLLIVFVVAVWTGGLASASWMPEYPAVGASGGLMGLLGLLLVFESLHRKLVPRLARRRLLAGLVLMVLMGFLGMSFIDNAAHAGGLLAGMVYAVIVFPPSATLDRLRVDGRDKLVGSIAGGAFLAICIFAIVKIVGWF